MLYRIGTLSLALAAVLLLFTACDSVIDDPPAIDDLQLAVNTLAPEDSSDQIDADNFEQGTHGFLTDRSFNVIQDETAFAELWANLFSHRDEVPERPEINFDETHVVFASLGQRPTGGYAVAITEARYMPDQDEIMVEVTERVPSEDCAAIQILTFPYTVATVEVVEGASYEFDVADPQPQDC
ncbi:MAG: protease complex subunit PrcB family protein [Bacteroidetes bacterium]|jgi:hypothetical protein|nr:protease complex subunit PrcB family protein [Bacteroidota bacterium]